MRFHQFLELKVMHSTGSLSAFSQEGNNSSSAVALVDIYWTLCWLSSLRLFVQLPSPIFKHPGDVVYNIMLLEQQPAAQRQEMVHPELPSVLAQIACLHNVYRWQCLLVHLTLFRFWCMLLIYINFIVQPSRIKLFLCRPPTELAYRVMFKLIKNILWVLLQLFNVFICRIVDSPHHSSKFTRPYAI